MNVNDDNKLEVRISEKILLSIPEAAAISNIGQCQIDKLMRIPDCPFLSKPSHGKRLIIRDEFEEFIKQNRDMAELLEKHGIK